MKTISKKILGLVLALAMILPLAACGEKTPGGSSAGAANVPMTEDGRPILTVGIQAKTNVTDFETNHLTTYLEEKLGCDIQFHYFSSSLGETKSQLSVMTAGSNEKLPDVIFSLNLNEEERKIYGDEGFFVDMAPYFDDPNWEKAKEWNWHEKMMYACGDNVDTYNAMMKSTRDAAGHMYGWPGYVGGGGAGSTPYAGYINTKWLEAVNMEMPTTYEELVAVLRAFKETDCNGNGIMDEIPMVGSMKLGSANAPFWIINNFVFAMPGNTLVADLDGKVYSPYITDEYRQGVKAVCDLVDEGLLSTMTWTMQDASELINMWTPADGIAKVGVVFGSPSLYTMEENKVLFEYQALPPLEGMHMPLSLSKASAQNFITTDCQNFDLACDFFMAFTDVDVMRIAKYGKEGEDWVEVLRAEDGTPGVKKLNPSAFTGQTNTTWSKNGPFLGSSVEGSPAGLGSAEPYTEEYLNSWNYKRGDLLVTAEELNEAVAVAQEAGKRYFKVTYTEEEEEQNGDAEPNIFNYAKETLALFAAKEMDINSDADWNKYLNEIDKMGLETLVKNGQAAFDRQNAK